MITTPVIISPSLRLSVDGGPIHEYDLSASIHHQGATLDEGHYETFARRHDGWRKECWVRFDDRQTESKEIVSLEERRQEETAYILMYKRKSTNKKRPIPSDWLSGPTEAYPAAAVHAPRRSTETCPAAVDAPPTILSELESTRMLLTRAIDTNRSREAIKLGAETFELADVRRVTQLLYDNEGLAQAKLDLFKTIWHEDSFSPEHFAAFFILHAKDVHRATKEQA
jgi:hypothetical protein